MIGTTSSKTNLLSLSTLLAVILAAGVTGTAGQGWAQDACDLSTSGVCTRTSAAARRACRHEVLDDYWIAIGNCRNESSDRAECKSDARDERDAVMEECVEQCIGRQDVCDRLGPDRYDPEIDAADFVSPAAMAANPNPYFPLVPGNEWTYEGDGETITVTVTDETVDILGVTCVVVHDAVEEDGELIEDTVDWYAQDTAGNLWYFGEISQNFEDGELNNLDGSWKAGVDGAKAGIIMFAAPQVGDFYRQEFFLGDAEDIGEVLSLTGDETSPAASCNGACVVTADTTPVEPGHIEHKYYAPGVGMIVEIDPGTGERLVEIVEFVTP
ncbi:MAG: hypothetical protein E4H03_00200 [Myxococcales bacterium]|nr:MAG: hypothetical protein E4H03_00200 [Myxococcales bacterium]